MSKQFLAVITIVILAFVGFFVLSGDSKSNTNDKSKSSGDSSQATSHTQGKGTAGVTLVEYGDFQCPFCAQYYPVLKQVKQQFGDQITFQFRHFPLVNIHQNAFAAARAAEAAGDQDKFWEMHDQLYENQSAWSEASNPSEFFKQYAQRIGLNVNQFQTDYASNAVNQAVNADIAAGTKLGIEGTPSFYLNGKKMEVSANAASFQKQIQEAIDKQARTKEQ